jgi:hypothetical protein
LIEAVKEYQKQQIEELKSTVKPLAAERYTAQNESAWAAIGES